MTLLIRKMLKNDRKSRKESLKNFFLIIKNIKSDEEKTKNKKINVQIYSSVSIQIRKDTNGL